MSKKKNKLFNDALKLADALSDVDKARLAGKLLEEANIVDTFEAFWNQLSWSSKDVLTASCDEAMEEEDEDFEEDDGAP